MPTRVMTFGTFDVFHIGHVNILTRAHDLGDELIFKQARQRLFRTHAADGLDLRFGDGLFERNDGERLHRRRCEPAVNDLRELLDGAIVLRTRHELVAARDLAQREAAAALLKPFLQLFCQTAKCLRRLSKYLLQRVEPYGNPSVMVKDCGWSTDRVLSLSSGCFEHQAPLRFSGGRGRT